MGRLSRLTEFFKNRDDGRRYHPEGDVNMPDEVSDPHTWRDESKARKREWFARNKRMFVTLSFLAIIFLGIAYIWIGSLVPQVLRNDNFQIAVYHVFLIGAVSIFSIRAYRSKTENLDWLVLVYGDSVKRYLGHYTTTESGDPAFVPVKGFTMLGFRSHPLTLGDMSNEMARQFAKGDRKADDPAKIRLHPGMMAIAQTDMGTIVAQLTGSLDPDEFGRETDIEATVPSLAKEEQMNDLKKELEEQVAENGHLKDKVSMLRDQRNTYKEMALEKEGDVQDRLIDFAQRVIHASEGRGGMGGGMSGGGGPVNPEPDYGDLEEQVDEEMDDDF